MTRWFGPGTLVAVWLLPAPLAAAATLSGRVEVRLAPAAAPERPSVRALGMPDPHDEPDRTRSVVYLEEAPKGAFEEPPRATATLDQRNQAFVPYVLAIEVGTTVDFPNSDPIYHNVFSYSKARRFDLGRYPQGHTKSVRFDKPGVVRVFCEIHSHMSAFILVFAHHFFSTTGPGGRYRIGGVPPGRYRLAVWTDGEVRTTRPVMVPEEAAAIEQDFVVE